MRRLSSRKRNKINLKNLNNKTLKITVSLIILLIIIICIYFYFIKNIFIRNNFEHHYTYTSSLNEETVFSLDKIVLFSSATVDTKELNNSVWNLDISGYTDICVYVNNVSNNNNSKNVIKQLYIDNINISQPEYGTPCLYRKSLQYFGKCSFSEDKILSDRIDFNIVEKDSAINYENNEIYNNLSTPITLGFYNKNVKTNFLNSDSQVEYNGKILKKAAIPQTSINCNVSFDINIINELDEHYICNVNFDIPFEDNNSSIYEDGYITKEINNLENYKFFRLK